MNKELLVGRQRSFPFEIIAIGQTKQQKVDKGKTTHLKANLDRSRSRRKHTLTYRCNIKVNVI